MDFNNLDEPSPFSDFWHANHGIESDPNSAIMTLATQALHARATQELEAAAEQQPMPSNFTDSHVAQPEYSPGPPEGPAYPEPLRYPQPEEAIHMLSHHATSASHSRSPMEDDADTEMGVSTPAENGSPGPPMPGLMDMATSPITGSDRASPNPPGNYDYGRHESMVVGNMVNETFGDSNEYALNESYPNPEAHLLAQLQSHLQSEAEANPEVPQTQALQPTPPSSESPSNPLSYLPPDEGQKAEEVATYVGQTDTTVPVLNYADTSDWDPSATPPRVESDLIPARRVYTSRRQKRKYYHYASEEPEEQGDIPRESEQSVETGSATKRVPGKRGRPRKSEAVEELSTLVNNETPDQTAAETALSIQSDILQSPAVKADGSEMTPAKRGPGRPRKSDISVSTPSTRGPGRPPKTPALSTPAQPTPTGLDDDDTPYGSPGEFSARGPGRPLKTPKRPVGRPRKTPVSLPKPPSGRGRGRPRKNPILADQSSLDAAVDTPPQESDKQGQLEEDAPPESVRKRGRPPRNLPVLENDEPELRHIEVDTASTEGAGLTTKEVDLAAPKRRGRPPKGAFAESITPVTMETSDNDWLESPSQDQTTDEPEAKRQRTASQEVEFTTEVNLPSKDDMPEPTVGADIDSQKLFTDLPDREHEPVVVEAPSTYQAPRPRGRPKGVTKPQRVET